MSYWDTSALLKLYLEETDSGSFLSLAYSSSRSVIAFIGKHEARTALYRREAESVLRMGAATILYDAICKDADLGRLVLIPESDELEAEFDQILKFCLLASTPIFIRTNDALHLAAARVAGETHFISADSRQRYAAEALGFQVLPLQVPLVKTSL